MKRYSDMQDGFVDEMPNGEWVKYVDKVTFANHIISLCGHPDPAEACRNVIAACKEEAE